MGTHVFPKVSEPVQITNNDQEHFFAGYYGTDSWSRNQKYVTVLETDIKYQLPDENNPATLGVVDIKTKEFIPLTQTRTWSFQEGCMTHWLGTSPDSLIIFNDLREGIFVSVIMNVYTKKELKTIPFPISAVSPTGKEAVSINFSRMRITRPVTGYGGNGQDAKEEIPFPSDDGLSLIDLETGQSKLLVSMSQVQQLVPELKEGGIEYFCHTRFSREGSKIFWLARAIPERNTVAFTVNRDGSNLQQCFPVMWGGSHFDWLSDEELMVTAEVEGKQYGHVLFTVGKQNYKRLGKGLLDFDGHGTFSPNGKWLVTDTYPSPGMREQKIYLMDMKSEAVLSLGRFIAPDEFNGDWRCDIHPSWSPKGNMIGFNSAHSGSRQVFIINLDEIKGN